MICVMHVCGCVCKSSRNALTCESLSPEDPRRYRVTMRVHVGSWGESGYRVPVCFHSGGGGGGGGGGDRGSRHQGSKSCSGFLCPLHPLSCVPFALPYTRRWNIRVRDLATTDKGCGPPCVCDIYPCSRNNLSWAQWVRVHTAYYTVRHVFLDNLFSNINHRRCATTSEE